MPFDTDVSESVVEVESSSLVSVGGGVGETDSVAGLPLLGAWVVPTKGIGAEESGVWVDCGRIDEIACDKSDKKLLPEEVVEALVLGGCESGFVSNCVDESPSPSSGVVA